MLKFVAGLILGDAKANNKKSKEEAAEHRETHKKSHFVWFFLDLKANGATACMRGAVVLQVVAEDELRLSPSSVMITAKRACSSLQKPIEESRDHQGVATGGKLPPHQLHLFEIFRLTKHKMKVAH